MLRILLLVILGVLSGVPVDAGVHGPEERVHPAYPFFVVMRLDSQGRSYLHLTTTVPLSNYHPSVWWHPVAVEGYARLRLLLEHDDQYKAAFKEAVDELRQIPVPERFAYARYRQPTSGDDKRSLRNWMFRVMNDVVLEPRSLLGGQSLWGALHLVSLEEQRAVEEGGAENDSSEEWVRRVQSTGSSFFPELLLVRERARVYQEMSKSWRPDDLFYHCPGAANGVAVNVRHPLFTVYLERRNDQDFQQAYRKALSDLGDAIRKRTLRDGAAVAEYVRKRFRELENLLRNGVSRKEGN